MTQLSGTAGGTVDPTRLVRPEMRELGIYHLDLSPCRHKLDQNEVPYDLPRRMKRRIAERWIGRSWAQYPDFHCDAVRDLLARHNGWNFEGTLVGNGSNELLGIAMEALARPGGEVLTIAPSFGLYPMFVRRAAAIPRVLLSDEDLRLPLAALEAEVESDPTRPVILCSPNNPTGDAVSVAQVDRLLSKMQGPLLLDNAYGEFSEHDYRLLLREHRHLVLFRTFSKAWSLGGLRLGYLLADPELVHQLIKVKLPYNVGIAHGFAAEEVLRNPRTAERRVGAMLARRPQWQEMLESVGLTVFPSEANFFLVRLPLEHDADVVRRGLEVRGIRVRDVSRYPRLHGCLRVSVGNGRALRDVEAALRDVLRPAER
ncbi:MAG: histidinol-phosphate aminotransferase family protein [Thermoanaerobaculia bacterium]|nr:histidinol-phosphate aminotransferase family protein [Thermoanaerobaculia bacterium]